MQDSNFKQWISSVRENYLTSKNFLKQSMNDPPEEPYKSKYKAKEVLSAILLDLEQHWQKESDKRIATIWSLLKYELGVIALETEEFSTGCDYLTECWDTLSKFSTDSECCILVLSVLNQLGILWSGRGESSKALTFLKEAEKIYHDYKENSEISPCLLEDLFNAEVTYPEDWKAFEKIFTLTLYYLAQVYEHLKENKKAAKYCHMTLKRQKESGDFEEKEWSVNCATLSQYYIQKKMFVVGRHVLACATCNLANYEASIDNRVEDEDVWDDIRRSKAEVAWCWVKYCINLLEECRDISEDYYLENIALVDKFSDEIDVQEIEKKVPDIVKSFEQAREVFLFGQKNIKEAMLYYTINDHANNNVQLVQDHSKLYKQLIYFETDPARQCKMQKRRIDMLENVLVKLNPQYYLAVCRQLRFELGETYYELIDLKLKIANAPEEGNIVPVKKINSFLVHAIEHFQTFIDSFKDAGGSLPEVFEDDLVRPVLVAHFFLGGLYLKFSEPVTSKQLHNFSKSEENYKYIMNYCEKNPSQLLHVQKELSVANQMVELMPTRIMQYTGSTIF